MASAKAGGFSDGKGKNRIEATEGGCPAKIFPKPS
jgi:hypothetical protein